MKIEKFKSLSNYSSDLIDGVIQAFGSEEYFLESFRDVARYGGDKGIGFIYYTETDQFWKDLGPQIKEMAEIDAESFTGSNDYYTVCEMLAGFKISKQNDLCVDKWLEFLYGISQDEENSLDALCDEWDQNMARWVLGVYAVERVSQDLESLIDNGDIDGEDV
ncbi:hypothetical protein [Salmonella phage SSBI34]|nr:hypothetical protein [Salmonella phage SSBI34]